MKPGDIYEYRFNFKDKQGSKSRPALIMQVDDITNTAIAMKITGSGPKNHFPHRISITHLSEAGLTKDPSFAQLDYIEFIPSNVSYPYRGFMNPSEFEHITEEFNKLFNI